MQQYMHAVPIAVMHHVNPLSILPGVDIVAIPPVVY